MFCANKTYLEYVFWIFDMFFSTPGDVSKNMVGYFWICFVMAAFRFVLKHFEKSCHTFKTFRKTSPVWHGCFAQCFEPVCHFAPLGSWSVPAGWLAGLAGLAGWLGWLAWLADWLAGLADRLA